MVEAPESVVVRRLTARERSARWRQRLRLRELVGRSLVLVPVAYLVAAVVLGLTMPAIDDARNSSGLLGLDEDAARSILEAVAAGMIAFAGLVVSVAVLVVQFAAGQYSPRLVLSFRRDPVIKNALGLFVAPGLYALVAVAGIGGSDGPRWPDLTVIMALVLMAAALVALFRFIERLLDLLRPRRIFARLLGQATVAVHDVYPFTLDEEPERRPRPATPATLVVRHGGRGGVLAAVDRAQVVRVARAADAVVQLHIAVGGYVPEDAPLFHVHGGADLDERALRKAAVFADGRTITQDPAFAMRALVDVAIRALSPAVNDPTTAVEALDALDPLLLRLSMRVLEGT